SHHHAFKRRGSQRYSWQKAQIAVGNEEPCDKRSVLQTASDGIMMMSNDEANRMIYEARLKAQRDEYSHLQGAIQEGRKEGEKERRKERTKSLEP
ncbi:MAG: Rpn family recombination-promoting nuclease/putative transposase, partial [Spirochaetaceae bacterium]|nr:Rpn family recombination-promoting nuclease/putative transposase [Spirochaetaceae bacterium]